MQTYNVGVSRRMSKLILPHNSMERRRHFEMFEVSQLSHAKNVLLCGRIYSKKYAWYYVVSQKHGQKSIAITHAIIKNKNIIICVSILKKTWKTTAILQLQLSATMVVINNVHGYLSRSTDVRFIPGISRYLHQMAQIVAIILSCYYSNGSHGHIAHGSFNPIR